MKNRMFAFRLSADEEKIVESFVRHWDCSISDVFRNLLHEKNLDDIENDVKKQSQFVTQVNSLTLMGELFRRASCGDDVAKSLFSTVLTVK